MNKREKHRALKKSVLELKPSACALLPNSINLAAFVKERSAEIQTLSRELDASKLAATRRAFQTLPRHMRRRAASHDINRLPRRLRERALEELKQDAPAAKSTRHLKGCRRWRRRPNNVHSTPFVKGWLETHLWHAKRCKMIDYWGAKVAAHLNEKCIKPSLRAFKAGALLHDYSYWKPFQVPVSQLRRFLQDQCVQFDYSGMSCDELREFMYTRDGVFVAPLRVLESNGSEHAVLFVHPASIATNILLDFQTARLDLSPVLLCHFVCFGKQAKSVETLFTDRALMDGCLGLVNDPRLAPSKPSSGKPSARQLLAPQPEPVTEESLNSKRAEALLPDSNRAAGQVFSIFLSPFTNGYHIIVPVGWARIVWYALVRQKPIKCAGLDAIDRAMLELGRLRYPQDFVGSPAHSQFAEQRALLLKARQERKPPAKQIPFSSFGLEDPFRSNFPEPSTLVPCQLAVAGRGTLEEMAHILDGNGILIGHVTSALNTSITKGCSTGIAFILKTHFVSGATVLFRNLASYNIARMATMSPISNTY